LIDIDCAILSVNQEKPFEGSNLFWSTTCMGI